MLEQVRPWSGLHAHKQLRAASGQGETEAIHGLELLHIVYIDGGKGVRRRRKRQCIFLLGQECGAVRGCEPFAGVWILSARLMSRET